MTRYSRQIRFAPFGEAGQKKLRSLRVAVVGLGGLGSTLAEHLMRAGVGCLRLIDRDVIEDSNLPRQTLYTEADARAGRPKADAAAERLRSLNADPQLEVRMNDLTSGNVADLLQGCDWVLDGLDNFATRYVINDFCRREGISWIYGGAVGGEGIVLRVDAQSSPCLRCLFPEPPTAATVDTCDTVGVLTPLPAMIASLQVCELFRGIAADPPPPRLWHFDVWSGRCHAATLSPQRDSCPCCDQSQFPALNRPHQAKTARFCGQGTVQVLPEQTTELDLHRIAAGWQGLGEVQQLPVLVRLRIDEVVVTVFADGRALIQGVETTEQARALYARYVGC